MQSDKEWRQENWEVLKDAWVAECLGGKSEKLCEGIAYIRSGIRGVEQI